MCGTFGRKPCAPSYFMPLGLVVEFEHATCSVLRPVDFDACAPRTCCFIQIHHSLCPHNNSISDTCHFDCGEERRSKEMSVAACLRSSIATQANSSSTALIARIWNDFSFHPVGGWEIIVFSDLFHRFLSRHLFTHSLLLATFCFTLIMYFLFIHLYRSVTHRLLAHLLFFVCSNFLSLSVSANHLV